MSTTTPAGFRAAGVTAGLKASGRPDVALVVNDGPDRHAAAVFTTNRVEAAPVTWSRQSLVDGRADAVVLNSGGANACTGAQGFQDTHATAEHTAEALGVSAGDVVVCSTGLIGELLPMAKLTAGVTAAAGSLTAEGSRRGRGDHDDRHRAQDRCGHPRRVERGWHGQGGRDARPALATMLVVVTTDAVTSAADLDAALREATRTTFDRIDSDGCMSTNDTVLAMASGASGTTVSREELTEAVREVCADLARQLIGDAEGAHHDIEIVVQRAASEADGPRSPAASPATTSSSARSSARTPTGAACWLRSARPRPSSSPHGSTCRSTACRSAVPAGSVRTARSSTRGPRGARRGRPARR